MDLDSIRFSYVRTNGIRLHVAEAGPEDGPLVILLHGFPEFWYGWRRQIPALARAGLRVVAPDQRGYNRSEKPEWLVGYRLETLVADVTGLIDHYGRERAVIVGHDWGGAVAWAAAMHQPERVEKLIALNTAPPNVMVSFTRRHPGQAFKSLYILGFQVPFLPEFFWSMNNFHLGARALTRTSRPGTFSAEDIACYKEAWSQPGAMTSMLNWYRASLRYPFQPRRSLVSAPTLILWGKRDAYLSAGLAQESRKAAPLAEVISFEHATHWVQHEEAAAVSAGMIEFVKEQPVRTI